MGNPIKHADSNDKNLNAISGRAISGFRAIDAHHGYEPGTFHFDDLDSCSVSLSADADGIVDGYYFLTDAGTTCARTIDVGGVIKFACDGADDFAQLATGNGVAGFCSIPTAVSSRKRLFFETLVKIDDVSDASFFIGLKHPTEGCAATAQIVADADDTLTANQQLVGFWQKTDDTLNTHVQEAANGTETTALSTTLSDGTWHKLTVQFVPGADSGELSFAIDNTVVKTYKDVDTALGAKLPDGVPLLGVIAFKGEAAENFYVDYVAYGYEGLS